jgi:hypothetical protein
VVAGVFSKAAEILTMTPPDPTPLSVAPPRLYVSGLPEAEQDIADVIVFWLHVMDGYHQDLIAAVDLFEHCLTLTPPLGETRWSSIAIRDGAMSIYHFGMSMSGIRRNLKHCPTLKSLVEIDKLRDANRAFRAAFPQIELLRHSISHAAEELPKILKGRHQRGVVIINSVVGNKFQTTKDGNKIGYEISRESVKKLTHVKETFYLAFQSAERSLNKLPKS